MSVGAGRVATQTIPAEAALARPPARRGAVWVHAVFFLATLVTTTLAGLTYEGVSWERVPAEWTRGLPFSLTLLGILFCHEMGHYVLARRHRIEATLPLFLPGPPVLIGTFGAFIRMRSQPPDRRALFDVGAAGPWAGLLVALPAAAWGLSHSRLGPVSPEASGIYFGDSLLFRLLVEWCVGRIPHGYDVFLHPVGLAAWIGLFVTALNLLPVGQLDGGHVVYAMFGRRHRWISRGVFLGVIAMGFQGWLGWFFWGVLLVWIGLDHPPTRETATGLDRGRLLLGWLTLAVFVATLVPVPFTFFEGGAGPRVEDLVPV